jgi:hypothetical protein
MADCLGHASCGSSTASYSPLNSAWSDWLTNHKEQRPSWEANFLSWSRYCPHFVGLEVHYRVYKSLPKVPVVFSHLFAIVTQFMLNLHKPRANREPQFALLYLALTVEDLLSRWVTPRTNGSVLLFWKSELLLVWLIDTTMITGVSFL